MNQQFHCSILQILFSEEEKQYSGRTLEQNLQLFKIDKWRTDFDCLPFLSIFCMSQKQVEKTHLESKSGKHIHTCLYNWQIGQNSDTNKTKQSLKKALKIIDVLMSRVPMFRAGLSLRVSRYCGPNVPTAGKDMIFDRGISQPPPT